MIFEERKWKNEKNEHKIWIILLLSDSRFTLWQTNAKCQKQSHTIDLNFCDMSR